MFTALLCLIPIGSSSAATTQVVGMDGKMHRPLMESKGRAKAFVFVSHDCPLCNAYSQEFVRLSSEFGKQILIYLVYSEPSVTSRVVRDHAKEYKTRSVPWLLDASRRFANACGATVTPEAVLFDSSARKVWSGRIDDKYVSIGVQRSSATQHDLKSALIAILNHRTPKPAGGQPVGCYILSPGTS